MGKVSLQPPDSSPTVDDLAYIVDMSGPTGKKVTLSNLISLFFNNIPSATPPLTGWNALTNTPSSVSSNGNRSYSMVFSGVDLTSTVSVGQRIKATRTVAAPTKCTSLNGTTQYYSKTTPGGMTFTDDFVVSAWVKLSSYQLGHIASRYNGTSGWQFYLDSSGRVNLIGYNASSGNISQITSSQSVPLNRWVHVAAQLDMSAFTNTTTTSYVMIDGVDVPATPNRTGTNPTALIQAGNLEIGSTNGGTQFFPGKLAQVAIYSAKVTQATVRASMNQTLVGTETSLISAYTFNNSVNDLNTTNNNNLTANGSALATNADSPYAQAATAGSLEYGIIMSAIFSVDTTLVVQVPEGSTLPTTGGISAVAYSGISVPYGFPKQRAKWIIKTVYASQQTQVSAVATTWYNVGSTQLNVPIGEWKAKYKVTAGSSGSTSVTMGIVTLSTSPTAETNNEFTAETFIGASQSLLQPFGVEGDLSLSAATLHYLIISTTSAGTPTLYFGETFGTGARTTTVVSVENSHL